MLSQGSRQLGHQLRETNCSLTPMELDWISRLQQTALLLHLVLLQAPAEELPSRVRH